MELIFVKCQKHGVTHPRVAECPACKADKKNGAAMSAWQPIETAPKDRVILLWERDAKCVTTGRWCDRYTQEWHAVVHGDYAPWNDWDMAPIFDATHWMPLPDPPVATEP